LQAYSDYQGKVRLIYHHYPALLLSETICVALEAADKQGKFWGMHNALIDDDPADIAVLLTYAGNTGQDIDSFTVDALSDAAEAAGLDMSLFRESFDDESLYEKVRQAKQAAVESGVKTAALFVNGSEYVKGHGTLEEFYEFLNAELERLETDAD